MADTSIGRVPESAACAEKFKREGVAITLSVTPCWCYGSIENVELPLVYRGVDRKTRHKLAVESLTMVGLEKRMDHRPNEMSGGQQQRVAIARAIAAQPPVILADEPTGNLDSASSKEILQILKSMHEQGKTVILITHDNGIAAQARRVVRIIDGKIESDFINKDYGKEEYIKNQLDA